MLCVPYVKKRFDRDLQGLDLRGAEWVRVSCSILAGRRMLLCYRQPLGSTSWCGVKVQLKCVSGVAACASVLWNLRQAVKIKNLCLVMLLLNRN